MKDDGEFKASTLSTLLYAHYMKVRSTLKVTQDKRRTKRALERQLMEVDIPTVNRIQQSIETTNEDRVHQGYPNQLDDIGHMVWWS